MIKRRNLQETKVESVEVQPSTDSPMFENKPKFTTYKEEAIEAIKYLKSQGIDIYDESRYGGMYLKQRKDVVENKIPEVLKTKISKTSKPINNSENNNDSQQLNNLFQHFKNKK